MRIRHSLNRAPMRRRRGSSRLGQSLVEYGLVLALVAIVVIGIVIQVGRRTAGAVCQVSGGLSATPTVQCPFAGAGPLYMLNETSGTVANDSSARHLDGAYQGTTPGISYTLNQAGPGTGRAVTLDGLTGVVTSPYTQSAITAYSAAIWFKTSQTGPANGQGPALIYNRGSGSGGGLTLGLLREAAGTESVFFGLDADYVLIGRATLAPYNDDGWHYALGTWAAAAGTDVVPGQFHLYVDGVEVGAHDLARGTKTSPLSGSGPTQVGYDTVWGIRFTGSLAQAAIYDQVVVPAPVVLMQYQAGLQP